MDIQNTVESTTNFILIHLEDLVIIILLNVVFWDVFGMSIKKLIKWKFGNDKSLLSFSKIIKYFSTQEDWSRNEQAA